VDRVRQFFRELDLAGGVLLVSVVGGLVAFVFWMLGMHWTEQLQQEVRDAEMTLYRIAATEKEVEALEIEKQKDDLLRVKQPTTYIFRQAERAGISDQSVAITPGKTQIAAQEGYVDEKFSIQIKSPVTRQQASDFLYDVETNTGRFKVTSIRIYPADQRTVEPTDLWDLTVELALRRPYVREEG